MLSLYRRHRPRTFDEVVGQEHIVRTLRNAIELDSPDFAKVVKRSQERFKRKPDATKHYESLRAQDELMTNFLKVMADHKLDAIVHKAFLISEHHVPSRKR